MLGRFLKSLVSGKAAARGEAAFSAQDFCEAADFLRRAQAQRPLDADGLYMLGAALVHCGNLDEAETALRAALELQPDHADAQKMLAMKVLFSGDWLDGFRLFEAMRHNAMRRDPGWKTDPNGEWLRCIDHVLAGIPAWRGEPLAGRRILVWSEHGRGDAIMTLRLLPELRTRYGATEVVGMSDLAEKCLFEAAGVSRFFEARWDWKPAPGDFDVHCSIFSLLHLLKVTPASIPGRVPYLRIPEVRTRAWRARLAATAGPKVGLVWAGNPIMPLDRLRSLSLTQLVPLLGLSGVTYFSLQKEGAARDELRNSRFRIIDMMDQCQDFLDTAALIENLDLVISVDSAVAHLAGAIGKPVWLLNRFESEWRWLKAREDSVWYPCMRIFNQTAPRNWAPVIDRMADELAGLLANGRLGR